MTMLDEGFNNPLETALDSGVNSLARGQNITFTRYSKQVLPQDGYVFWVVNGPPITVKGSLHYGTEQVQDEDQTIGVNAVIFTAEQEVAEFNRLNPGTLWVADWQTPSGATIQIAFSKRGPFYAQAGLYHYSGFAVYPALAAQLINTVSALPPGPIVSNSLPIWLNLPNVLPGINSFAPNVPVYASYLVPENVQPPYIVAHIEPNETRAIGAFPIMQWTGVSPVNGFYDLPASQLMADRVKLTFYGLTAQQGMAWLSAIISYSAWTDAFGFMNSPAFRDEKREQSEITAIAMKKTMTIHASYYLNTADALARNLILSAGFSSITTE